MRINKLIRIVVCWLILPASISLAQPAYHAIDDVDEASMHALLEEHLPMLAAELEEMRVEDPDAYLESFEEHAEFVAYLRELKQEHEVAFEAVIRAEQLEYEGWEIAGEIAETSDPARREELRARLREILTQVFDARMVEREAEVQAMTEELNEIKAIMEQRRGRKALIVDRQVERMVDAVDESLEWW